MVAMRVADEYVADRLAADRRQQCLEMSVVIGTGVDDGKRILADEIAVGPAKGERAGVVRRHPDDARGDRLGRAGNRLEPRIELERHELSGWVFALKTVCRLARKPIYGKSDAVPRAAATKWGK